MELTLVKGADPQPGQPVVVENYRVVVPNLETEDIRHHIPGLEVMKRPSRLGVEGRDHAKSLFHLLERNLELTGHEVRLGLLKKIKRFLEDFQGK